MPDRQATRSRTLEVEFRGLALQDGLREAAEALAREIGGDPGPVRRRKDASQFPFEAALAQHLRKMEARYGGLLEAAPDPMIVANGAGEVVLLNLQAEASLGYTAGELLGRALSTVLDGDILDALDAGDDDGPLGRRVHRAELRALRKDGEHFPVEAMASSIKGEEGRLAIIALRDISARRAVERRLTRLEARARTLFEQAPDPMIVLNKRGNVLLFNARAGAAFGFGHEEILGQPASVLVPHGLLERLVAEDGGPAFRAVAETAGTPIAVEARRKDGAAFAAEMTLGALKGSDGVLFVAAFRRAAADASAATGPDLRHLVLDAAPDALVAIDRRGDIVFFNAPAERRFGYGRDEVAGLPITRLLPEGFAERFMRDPLALAEASLAHEFGTGIELPAVGKDGATFRAELMLNTIDTLEGPLTVIAIRDARLPRPDPPVAQRDPPEADLQRRDLLERRLRDLTRARDELSQFAEVAANNLREPVRHLIEGGERLAVALAQPGDGIAPARGLSRSMIEEAGRMQALVTDLLAYCRLSAEPLRTARTSTEVLVRQAMSALSREIADSGAVISSGALPEIECDADEIALLFRHLFANAIAYRGGEAPRIGVSATPNSAGDWVFAVADNGIGIERQYYERIFQEFQRLHRHRAIAGTGMGLAFCRRIAERHGGRIWVDSRPALGSTFYLALPERRVA